MRRVAIAAGLVALSFAHRPGAAQSTPRPQAGVTRLAAPDTTPFAGHSAQPRVGVRYRRYAPLVSAVVPGGGQFMLGHDRFFGYAAVELLAWWRYTKDNHERADQERRFKELSREVARAHFTSVFPDSSWVYYEWMRDYIESGQFSLSPTGPIVPETDTATYNGFKWQLLLGTHASYADALAAYQQIAIRPEYRWSWKDARLQWDIYRRTTDKRNDASRAMTRDLLVVGANHILSMVDAFASIRLEMRAQENGRTAIGAAIKW